MSTCSRQPKRQFQTALLQADPPPGSADALALSIEHSAVIPALHSSTSSPHDVLIRVLAVALNHCDYKMPTHYLSSGDMTGCDFSGVVIDDAEGAVCETGTRVCGSVFPYLRPKNQSPSGGHQGAFAEFILADSRRLLRIPDTWSDLEGAALGAVGWGTVGLALLDPQALALPGFPSQPSSQSSSGSEHVLVYGGATATGAMACQLLKLSGHVPIAVTSTQSAQIAKDFGADAACSYTSPDCADQARGLASAPIRYALDCITTAESAATCFAAIARTGGRYACLEGIPDSWRTRRAVKVKVVMGYEGMGRDFHVGSDKSDAENSTYNREYSEERLALYMQWKDEMQRLLDENLIKHHPILEVDGRFEGVLKGISMLRKGEVKGQKIVVRIADAESDD